MPGVGGGRGRAWSSRCLCLVQKGFVGLGFLVGGSSALTAVFYWFVTNLSEAIAEYWKYLVGYSMVAGLISFAVIYRWGGVSNPRTFDLIRWFMQLVGLVLVYSSTSYVMISLAMIFIALFTYHTPMR